MKDLMVKPVDVLGDTVMAAKDNNGVIWVGIKWMCKAMGMTEGQWKRQITNIQKDLLLSKAGSNLILPIDNNGEKEVFCLKNDYLPIWLAKINITPNIQKNNPELADKLLQYQLKAKDILADAFMPKYENQTNDMQYTKADIPVGEIARLSSVMDRVMVRQNSKPHDIARAFEMLCGQFGIMLPNNFVNEPEYEQLTLENIGR